MNGWNATPPPGGVPPHSGGWNAEPGPFVRDYRGMGWNAEPPVQNVGPPMPPPQPPARADDGQRPENRLSAPADDPPGEDPYAVTEIPPRPPPSAADAAFPPLEENTRLSASDIVAAMLGWALLAIVAVAILRAVL